MRPRTPNQSTDDTEEDFYIVNDESSSEATKAITSKPGSDTASAAEARRTSNPIPASSFINASPLKTTSDPAPAIAAKSSPAQAPEDEKDIQIKRLQNALTTMTTRCEKLEVKISELLKQLETGQKAIAELQATGKQKETTKPPTPQAKAAPRQLNRYQFHGAGPNKDALTENSTNRSKSGNGPVDNSQSERRFRKNAIGIDFTAF